jgi:hypothetical protein
VKCKAVEPAGGALTSTAITNPHAAKAANYADFKGNKRWAYWHADLELAEALDAFHAGRFNKRNQYLTFADLATGKPVAARHDLRLTIAPHYVGADVFEVKATFLDEARERYPQPEPPISHADGPIHFRIFRQSGVEPAGPGLFRVVRGGLGGTGAAILAYHPGNEQYRHAEQPARMQLAALKKGKPQTIGFPTIGPLKADAPPTPLRATSDSGLAVTYAVGHGPAVVENGTLRVCGIPPRAKWPLEISVTAYQWGSAVEPYVQTAAPVTQRIIVEK